MLQFDFKRFHPAEISAIAVCSAISTIALGTLAMPLPRDDRSAELPTKLQPKAVPFVGGEMFAEGAESLVARAVGHAEGTRTATGARTGAYQGHSDPGNGVWNLGSFSYQHAAKSPEDADRKQLARLKKQFAVISQQATSKGLVLSDLEKLNAIDLANQAPLAALDTGGFIDRLLECRREIVCVRSRSFIDARTGRLDAPGLGNNIPQVERDQQRRVDAIDRVVNLLRKKTP
jgi:hypothetical protein